MLMVEWPALDDYRPFQNLFHEKLLVFTDGTALADLYRISLTSFIVFIVRFVLFVGLHHFTVQRMTRDSFDLNHDCFFPSYRW